MAVLGGWVNLGVVVTDAGSYSRLIDSCITQLRAQGPSRTCNESKEGEKGTWGYQSKGGVVCGYPDPVVAIVNPAKVATPAHTRSIP